MSFRHWDLDGGSLSAAHFCRSARKMRLTAAIACLIVAFDCAEKADGIQIQELFAAQAIWVWWIPAGLWGIAGIRVLLNGAA